MKYLNTNLADLKSPFPEVREGAYDNLRLSFERTKLNLDQKERILSELLSKEFLFWEIEKGITSQTVVRSYSLLVINLVLFYDKDFCLSRVKGDQLLEALGHYITQETDWRTYDDELGYIHAAAHFSDLLTTLSWYEGFEDGCVLYLAMKFILNIEDKWFPEMPKEDRVRIEEAIEYLVT